MYVLLEMLSYVEICGIFENVSLNPSVEMARFVLVLILISMTVIYNCLEFLTTLVVAGT